MAVENESHKADVIANLKLQKYKKCIEAGQLLQEAGEDGKSGNIGSYLDKSGAARTLLCHTGIIGTIISLIKMGDMEPDHVLSLPWEWD